VQATTGGCTSEKKLAAREKTQPGRAAIKRTKSFWNYRAGEIREGNKDCFVRRGGGKARLVAISPARVRGLGNRGDIQGKLHPKGKKLLLRRTRGGGTGEKGYWKSGQKGESESRG